MITLPRGDLKGWRVVPDLSAIRQDLRRSHGLRQTQILADNMVADGWRVAFDLREDGIPDELVCERERADGSVQSVVWHARLIRCVVPSAKIAKPM